jgi:hypothetical protein
MLRDDPESINPPQLTDDERNNISKVDESRVSPKGG